MGNCHIVKGLRVQEVLPKPVAYHLLLRKGRASKAKSGRDGNDGGVQMGVVNTQIYFLTFIKPPHKSGLPDTFSKNSRNTKILQTEDTSFTKSTTLLFPVPPLLNLTDCLGIQTDILGIRKELWTPREIVYNVRWTV